MRKNIAISALLLIFGLMLGMWACLPDPDTQIRKAFAQAGFHSVTLPTPEKRWGAARYHNIKLDPDGFSTIDTLTLKRGLLGTLTAIDIDGLSLTGELLNDTDIDIAGWDQSTLSETPFFQNIRADLSFQNAQLSLLSKAYGGISLNFDAQFRPQISGGYEFQSTLSGNQENLSATMSADGFITPQGAWHSDLEVQEAKFESPLLNMTRISGNIEINGTYDGTSEVIGELQAGGLMLMGLPWTNVALTLDGSVSNTRLILGAKSTKVEDVELGLTIGALQNPEVYAGSLHAGTVAALVQYFEIHKALPFQGITARDLKAMKNADITFQGKKNNALIVFLDNRAFTLDTGKRD